MSATSDPERLAMYRAAYGDDSDQHPRPLPKACPKCGRVSDAEMDRRLSKARTARFAAEQDRDDLADRLSELLCDLTGGKLSKTNYSVQTMKTEIEECLSRELEVEAAAERDDLRAKVERVEALHASRTIQVTFGECATEECDHEDECPTAPFQQCIECDRIADGANAYYGEGHVGLTAWPCPTLRALRGQP